MTRDAPAPQMTSLRPTTRRRRMTQSAGHARRASFRRSGVIFMIRTGDSMENRPWLAAYPQGVPADIDASQYHSLVQLMEESFVKFAARTAYVFMGKEVSFGET